MQKILLQFDTDPLPSSFDRVVAVDAGVDQLMSYGGVTCENVVPLVHGAMFTRGPEDLKNTAIFIGGSGVKDGEKLLRRVTETFFGPLRVSVMMDSNGCNTTAAAAVVSAARHQQLRGSMAIVLGGTGPVGQRVARMLALRGARVRIASRSLQRAEVACQQVRASVPEAVVEPVETAVVDDWKELLGGTQILVSAGAAGAELMPTGALEAAGDLRVAIDLNAVPPAGVAGIKPADKAAERDGTICYGAIGVGGLKMRIHRIAVQRLFERNDLVLDAEAILELAEQLDRS
ncbi:MAG: bifunctional NADP-dependent methylenetetrahydromethanopterin dehydrogenase/methylenetetrahydrofolate dehydrogenase [Planctomycetota bacterium]|nr:MAG: bifunctional NADP-dependent methylenetetrahydromethanopterin dehydrogenase/methylenetetrahydrofolate dehydrogenase [Planctomycetota bacterium]